MAKNGNHAAHVLVTLATAGVIVSLVLPWMNVTTGPTKEGVAVYSGIGELGELRLKEVVGPHVLPALFLAVGLGLMLWSLRGNAWFLRAGAAAVFFSAVLWYLFRFVDAREAVADDAVLGAGFYTALLASVVGLAAASRAVRTGKVVG